MPDPVLSVGDISDPHPGVLYFPSVKDLCRNICSSLLYLEHYSPPEEITTSTSQSHVFLQSELPSDIQEQLRDAMRTAMRSKLESMLPASSTTGPTPPEYQVARTAAIDSFLASLEETLMDPSLPVLAVGT